MAFDVPLNPQGFTSNTTNTTTYTTGAYTLPAGANKRLVAVVGAHAGATGTGTTGISGRFGSTEMQGRLGGNGGADGVPVGNWWFNVYDLAVGSSTDAATLRFEISTSRRFNVVVFVIEDADQSEAPMVSSVANTLSHTLNDVPSGWLAIDGLIDLGAVSAEPTVVLGQTLLDTVFGSSTDRWAAASYTDDAGGTQSFDWTNASATSNTGHVILAYKPASGGGTATPPPTGLTIDSLVAGPNGVTLGASWTSGGGVTAGYNYAVVDSTSSDPSSSTSTSSTSFTGLTIKGSRSPYLAVQATGGDTPSSWAFLQFDAPDLEIEYGEGATGVTQSEFETPTVTVPLGAALGPAGVIEARWIGVGDNVIGEDITINVLEEDGPPPEPGTWVIEIDGVEKTQTFLGNHVTPSGTWPCYHLGDLPDGSRAYMDLYNGKPEFCRVRIHRMPGYASGSHLPSKAIVLNDYAVEINGTPYTISVAPGAIGHAATTTPVDLTVGQITTALNAKRMLPYSEDAFVGWQYTPSRTPDAAPGGSPKDYNPARFYGPSSSVNSIGVVSGQGGEYSSSRGFISGEEAAMISAALDGQTSSFNAFKDWVLAQSYYAVTLPHLCIPSPNHHMMRDPQIPLSGDSKYYNEGSSSENFASEGSWRVPYGYPFSAEIKAFYCDIVSVTNANPCVVTYDGPLNPTAGQGIYIRDAAGMTELAGSFVVGTVNTTAKTFTLRSTASGNPNIDSTAWGTYTGGATGHSTLAHDRNQEHQFNHGALWWVMTGDPLAAILIQGIQAYNLAAVYQSADPGPKYRGRFTTQRGTVSTFNILWWLRDVRLNASGPNLWDNTRMDKMIDDLWESWDTRIDAVDAGADATSTMLRLLGSCDGDSGYGISNFQLQMYGGDAPYLWSMVGRPKMLERFARGMVLRFRDIGGTAGIYGSASGSAFGARAVSGGPIEYSDAAGLAAWVTANTSYATDRFSSAPQHKVMRCYWLLKYAQDAISRGWCDPVDGVDDAIAAMEAARSIQKPTLNSGEVSWKHGGIPFTTAGGA